MNEILTRADALMEAHPDSALILLESVHYPDELSQTLWADYVLLATWAKDKIYKNIAKDTLIFQIKDYFLRKRDWEKATLVAFYCGRVYQAQRNYEKALNAYLIAETVAQQITDESRKGLIQYFIGELYYVERLYPNAIERFKSAYDHFVQSPDNYIREILTLNIIGNSFFLAKQRENALMYFDKALKLSESRRDSNQIALTRHNMGVAYLANDELQPAKTELFHALKLLPDTSLQTKIYLTLAGMYEKNKQIDSALYFSGRAVELFKLQKEETDLVSAYKLLSRLEEKNGNLRNALYYHRQYLHYYDWMRDEKEKANLLELQKKYNFELIKGVNNRLVIQSQWALLSLSLLIIAIFLILFIFSRTNQQNKNALSEAKQTIYQLKEMVNMADDSIHAFLVRHFDVVKKISLLEGYLREEEREKGKEILKKVNKIIYEKDCFDWEIFYETMNKLYKGYFDKIKTIFPLLFELEYKICCLTKSGLNNTEIAIILKLNVNIIQIRKTAIRKKLNIPEHGDIVKFMDTIIAEEIKTFVQAFT
ncbi:MAG: tetratricopeptide repeat protein [Dysgonamonadaceae bacterium]|jgi:tetratricopeptide (TPR) repeat protein|nr:tetratricopeptide repeat protein [Dysgonamonadaceae bacterium]